MLAAYGVVAAYVFGLLMNLSGWPFILGVAVPGHEGSLDFVAGAPLVENLQRFGGLHAADLDGQLRHRPGHHHRRGHRSTRPGGAHDVASRHPPGLAAGRVRPLSRSVSALTVAGAVGALSCCPVRARDGRISLRQPPSW